jgi:hypothetical protein
MFILIILYLIFDWKKTTDFRNKTRINIENSDIFFSFNNSPFSGLNTKNGNPSETSSFSDFFFF